MLRKIKKARLLETHMVSDLTSYYQEIKKFVLWFCSHEYNENIMEACRDVAAPFSACNEG